MTLCVAWKRNEENNVRLASDSRITMPGVSSDYGIKVFQVPVKIFEPRDSQTGEQPLFFESTYGMGFSGSFLAAQTLREFLFIVLQQLCAIPNDPEVSFKGICDLVLKYVNHLTHRLSSDLENDCSLEFFLCGRCPETNKIVLAKFFNQPNCPYNFTIYHKDHYIWAIGSGKETFSEMLSSEQHPDMSQIMSAIDEITQSDNEPNVGGNIQYGEFDNKLNFRIGGILRDQVDVQGLINVKYFLAGIEMNGSEFYPKAGELFVIGRYIDPFNRRHTSEN